MVHTNYYQIPTTPHDKKFDLGIIGAGLLGVSISFWLSELYDCSVVLVESENRVALHTSSRNTGVIHRPFYLDPDKKTIFARAAQKSYPMWSNLATSFVLPWKTTGTIEVATRHSDLATLEKYKKWSISNGMKEEEIDILDSSAITRLEPEVKCVGAIFSKTDASVSFGQLTSAVALLGRNNGVEFLGGLEAKRVEETGDGAEIIMRDEEKIRCGFVVNAAGGGALDITHASGLASGYSNLYFRGEYWRIDEPFASKIKTNVYCVPRYMEFPFLDPHFIVRANGRREIGPNAALVSGPKAYSGLPIKSELVKKIFERPESPKIRLFINRKFLSLVWNEWKSSFSKKAMCERVRKFIPSIRASMLNQRGVAGIRSSLIDKSGFVPEAVQIYGERSLHILNYNSPGATGAPSFSAWVVSNLETKGFLDDLRRKKSEKHTRLWDFEKASDLRVP